MPAQRADDAETHGIPEAQRAAHRNHELALAQLGRVAQFERGQLFRFHFDYRQIAFPVQTDERGRHSHLAASGRTGFGGAIRRGSGAGQRHPDGVRATDDVRVSNDVAGGVENHAGARRGLRRQHASHVSGIYLSQSAHQNLHDTGVCAVRQGLDRPAKARQIRRARAGLCWQGRRQKRERDEERSGARHLRLVRYCAANGGCIRAAKLLWSVSPCPRGPELCHGY